MLQSYNALRNALDPELEVFDALLALSYDLEAQDPKVQEQYWKFMRDLDAMFGLDIMVAHRELEEQE